MNNFGGNSVCRFNPKTRAGDLPECWAGSGGRGHPLIRGAVAVLPPSPSAREPVGSPRRGIGTQPLVLPVTCKRYGYVKKKTVLPKYIKTPPKKDRSSSLLLHCLL